MSLDQKTDLNNLMDLAETNVNAALAVFGREYDWVAFQLSSNDSLMSSNMLYTVDVLEDKIVINSYEYFKKFINMFGHLLKQLEIEIDEYSKYKLAQVYQLISQSCTSIEELRFVYDDDAGDCETNEDLATVMSENPLLITTSIPSLKNFSVENIFVKSDLQIGACFPNLISLNLITVAASDPKFIETHIPSLKELFVQQPDESLEFDYFDGGILQIERENVQNMMRLNRQLESVGIGMGIDVPFLEFLRDTLPSMRKLAMGCCDFDGYDGVDIVFEKLEAICLDDVSGIQRLPPIAANNLVELELVADGNILALEYIKKQRSLKILRLQCEYFPDQLLELNASLRDLKALNLEIADGEWPVDDVIRLLTGLEFCVK